jgi:hypothetical protein
MPQRPRNEPDQGSILPIVLVVSLVLGLVVVAVATYTATTLRYGQVSEARAGRIAAAQGAMDDTLEKLSLRGSLCSTANEVLAFPEPLNDTNVVVTCSIVADELPGADGWAIAITGEGAPANSDPTFDFTLGGTPEVNGPVYVHDPSRVALSQPTTLVEGDLWYPDVPCATSAASDPGVQFKRSATVSIPRLSFNPNTRGYYCVNRTWSQLFGSGPDVSPKLDELELNPDYLNPDYTTQGECRVFSEGRYTSLPLSNNNYFKSGVYLFENTGLISIAGSQTTGNKLVVTMGQVPLEGYPVIGNSKCDAARQADSPTGATLYTTGDTRFFIGANSGLEISGSAQGNSNVAVHVLGSSLGYSTPFMSADNGAQKELALRGLLWAPYQRVVFETVPTQKAAVLQGGAVVAGFSGGISGAADGFVIQVGAGKTRTKLLIESTATDSKGANTVRVVADYRPSTGDVAVNSRRVCDKPSCAP